MTTEIKFECISCQQRILVHADAAGMHTDCPSCGSGVTVPQTASLNDRHYGMANRSRDKRRLSGIPRDSIAARDDHAAFDEPELTSLRQDLLEASVETTRIERELTEAQSQLAATRAEAARSRLLQEAASAEAEKLHANARHIQAELKSFQTERLALKNDLTGLRQKLGAAEERFDSTQLELLDAQAKLGEQEAELEQAQRAVEALRKEIGELRTERGQLSDETVRLAGELSSSEHRAALLTAELQELEGEFEAAKELLNEAQANRTTALREIGALTDERATFLLQLAEARAQLAVLAQTEAKLKSTTVELDAARQELAQSEQSVRKARMEVDELRRTVSENRAGRDFIEVRAKLEVAQAEHARLLEETRQIRESLSVQENASREAEDRAKGMRQQLQEALRAAEAGSESRLRRDNDVLRGIVARQNSELEQKHLHLVRLKRARLALQIVYSVFMFGLVAVGVLAVKFVPALRF